MKPIPSRRIPVFAAVLLGALALAVPRMAQRLRSASEKPLHLKSKTSPPITYQTNPMKTISSVLVALFLVPLVLNAEFNDVTRTPSSEGVTVSVAVDDKNIQYVGQILLLSLSGKMQRNEMAGDLRLFCLWAFPVLLGGSLVKTLKS